MTTNAADALERIIEKVDDSETVPVNSHPECNWLCKLVDIDDWHKLRDAVRASLADWQGEAVPFACYVVWEGGSSDFFLGNGNWSTQHAAKSVTPLYARPAPAAVTDAMVERALDAYYCHGISWKEAAELCGDTREEMRAALAAALQIGGE